MDVQLDLRTRPALAPLSHPPPLAGRPPLVLALGPRCAPIADPGRPPVRTGILLALALEGSDALTLQPFAIVALIILAVFTSPAAAAGSSAEVLGRFAVWGDVRNDPGRQSHARPASRPLVQVLEKTNFSHSITVGDSARFLGSGDQSADATRYDNFLAAARPLTDGHTTHWLVWQPRPCVRPGRRPALPPEALGRSGALGRPRPPPLGIFRHDVRLEKGVLLLPLVDGDVGERGHHRVQDRRGRPRRRGRRGAHRAGRRATSSAGSRSGAAASGSSSSSTTRSSTPRSTTRGTRPRTRARR